MTAASTIAALRLLWELRAQGARVWAETGRLRYEIPHACGGAEILDRLRASKAPLLALLTEPCPCSACTEENAEPHGPRCYCPACLDADPKWEAWRQEVAEQDRLAAEARDAIEEEGRS